ncbi:MAG: hypothetical protein LBR51_02520 [Bacteroidales bacterium]|jgi:hypothetical protein|nr:hypothetical protein [Bacteroidales bacterium]
MLLKKHIPLVGLVLILLSLSSVGLYCFFSRTSVLEPLKQQTAKILAYEYIPNQNIDINLCHSYQKQDSAYTLFRARFRYHFQTIAAMSFEDSSRLLLISEPPPFFELDSLENILRRFTHSTATRTHKIGYDGAITDLLVSLANVTSENLQNVVCQIAKQMYLSGYKPYCMDLSQEEKRVYFSKQVIDYQISLSEFNDWFLEEKEAFMAFPDTMHPFSIDSIFSAKKYGVFFSQLPGFVAWALPKNSDLKDYAKDIRAFALDADLILGALADTATLVIIGRERELPLNELPPLNTESVLLLASVTEKELSQSLDVNDFLAGKMKNGQDWCPTYLSKELENTEFGHLLTITDILLKDWSEKGTIKEAHYRYPEPGYYPFRKPLFRLLGLNELVYNWNTQNAMYAIDKDNITIYTLNRTGALPVSYFNSQERSRSIGYKYEQQAYHYFASTHNTDLARVVQYTAIYQLFMDNGIHFSGDLPSAFPRNKPYLLLNPVISVMDFFKNMEDTEIKYLSDTISTTWFAEYQQKKVDEQLYENEQRYGFRYADEERSRIFKEVVTRGSTGLKQDLQQARTMLRALDAKQYQALARYLSYPRGTRVHDRETYQTLLRARQLNKLLSGMGKNHLSLVGFDLSKVRDFYAKSLAQSGSRYLKTPSLIVTFNDFLTTGGHNLSSRISRVKSLSGYKTRPQNTTPDQSFYPAEPSSISPKEEKVIPTTPTNATTPERTQGTPKTHTPPTLPHATGKTTTISKPNTPTPRTLPGNVRPRASVIPTERKLQRGF